MRRAGGGAMAAAAARRAAARRRWAGGAGRLAPLRVRLLLLVEVEVDALALLQPLDPCPLEVVAVLVVEDAEAVALVVEPLALVHAAVAGEGEDADAVAHAVLPLAVVRVAVLVVEDAAPVPRVVEPLPRVLLAQLALLALEPRRAHPVPLARLPAADVPRAVGELVHALPVELVGVPLAQVLARPPVRALAARLFVGVVDLLGEVDGAARPLLVRQFLHLGRVEQRRRLDHVLVDEGGAAEGLLGHGAIARGVAQQAQRGSHQ